MMTLKSLRPGHLAEAADQNRYLVGVKHPAPCLLLAYIRRQLLAQDLPLIIEHLRSCDACSQLCEQYTRLSAALDMLAQSHAQQAYPSLVERITRQLNL